MANIKSQIKRAKTNEKTRSANTSYKSAMRTAIKKVEVACKEGNKEAASTNYNIAIQRVDKAMSSGKIHKNKAARLKSRLTKMKNEM